MAIEIRPYTEDLIGVVREFNARLRSGDKSAVFPENHIPKWLPKIGDTRIYQEYFLALENRSTTRGAYILKHQDFSINGEIHSIACLQLPLSEGIVDKTYNYIGVLLINNALQKQSRLFALGMGGLEETFPKLLKAMGWSLFSVPFYFKVNHPTQFLRNIKPLRGTKLKRTLLDGLSASGLGWLTLKLSQRILQMKSGKKNSAFGQLVTRFSDWSDKLWNRCRDQYSILAVRDSTALNTLYPIGNKRFLRLKITDQGRTVGWSVVLDTAMCNHKHFGNMRVGSIIDCLAMPEDAFKVIASSAKFLQERAVDLIVSNQSHHGWCCALGEAGFLKGPSNFLFASSRSLAKKLESVDPNKITIHLNRGDGDGPIHL